MKVAVGPPPDWVVSARPVGAAEVKACCRWPHGLAAAGCNSLEGQASDSQAKEVVVTADPSCTGGLCDLRQISNWRIFSKDLGTSHCNVNSK